MKVALVQLASPDDEAQSERISRVEKMLRALVGIDLAVLPELWSVGYFHFGDYDRLAEELDGPTISMCARVAKDLRMHIHVGSFVETDTNGGLRNTSVLLDEHGNVVHRYSKIHVFGYQSLESSLLTPGTSLTVATTTFGQMAGTTCYDLRFPGLWMELSDRAVEIVVVPAAWPAVRKEHWQLLTSTRAVEHQIFVIACNAVGEQDGIKLGGHSRIVDPSGKVLAECGETEEVLVVEIDPEQVARVRNEFPVLADRLPVYSGLSN